MEDRAQYLNGQFVKRVLRRKIEPDEPDYTASLDAVWNAVCSRSMFPTVSMKIFPTGFVATIAGRPNTEGFSKTSAAEALILCCLLVVGVPEEEVAP